MSSCSVLELPLSVQKILAALCIVFTPVEMQLLKHVRFLQWATVNGRCFIGIDGKHHLTFQKEQKTNQITFNKSFRKLKISPSKLSLTCNRAEIN